MLDNIQHLRKNRTADEFELDGTKFIIDLKPQKTRMPSGVTTFELVKTPGFLMDYANLATHHQGVNIVQMGVNQLGFIALIDKLFSPKFLLGVDTAKATPSILDYVKTRKERLKLLCETPQTERDLILSMIDCDLDIVFDDASHLYEPTRKSFNFLFQKLKPGGLYYIEDWAWAHQKGTQNKNHPWHDKPALTNFLIDLVASIGGDSPIASLNITQRAVLIRKAKGARADLRWNNLKLRGRKITRL